MPLTAAEVRATQFSTTRMRGGYDMDEVDAFLDIIEADVSQYADELQRSRDGEAVLRTQCDQLQARLTVAEQRLAEAQEQLAAGIARRERPVATLPTEPKVPADARGAARRRTPMPPRCSRSRSGRPTRSSGSRRRRRTASAPRCGSMLDEQKALLDRSRRQRRRPCLGLRDRTARPAGRSRPAAAPAGRVALDERRREHLGGDGRGVLAHGGREVGVRRCSTTTEMRSDTSRPAALRPSWRVADDLAREAGPAQLVVDAGGRARGSRRPR